MRSALDGAKWGSLEGHGRNWGSKGLPSALACPPSYLAQGVGMGEQPEGQTGQRGHSSKLSPPRTAPAFRVGWGWGDCREQRGPQALPSPTPVFSLTTTAFARPSISFKKCMQ